jgi:hypothetical protein
VTVERVREDCVDPSCKDSWFYHRAEGRVSRFREHLDDRPLPRPPPPRPPPPPPLPRRSQGESIATASGSRFREHLDEDDEAGDADILVPRPPGPVPTRRRPNKLQKVRRKPLPPTPPPEHEEEIRRSRSKSRDRDHETSSVRTVARKVGQSVQAVLALPKAGVDLVKSAVSNAVAKITAPLPPMPPMPSWHDIRGFAGKGVGFIGRGFGTLAPFRWQNTFKFKWR